MLTREEVKSVAALARIQLSEAEEVRFQEELSAVLDFFSELETVNTDAVDPIGHITGRLGEARVDIPDLHTESEEKMIQKNFPESDGDYLAVRSVF
jgi:aspartyl-tRNA(Asn)/glutamyl-tRNA(Gln) amidotransferase subunit C